MYRVISSGSSGNCVIYHNSIAVDMGIPYSKIEAYKNSLQIALRFACGAFLADKLEGIKNIDILKEGRIYDYSFFKISPIVLYHDVPNFGFRIFKDDTKIMHATDTCHLEGISAKNYNLYAIESNYNEDTVFESIRIQESKGEFAYQKGAINSHLSEQQAREFIFRNKGENSEVLRLHESSSY